jgi:hypothetical protein
MNKLNLDAKIYFYCAAFRKEMGIAGDSIEGIPLRGEIMLSNDCDEDEIQLSILDHKYKDKDGETVSMHVYIDKEMAVYMQKYLEAYLHVKNKQS